ncbi:uncharacterized protein F4807DRAFT_456933 [Annulohypoxylon truncatum]|uniref:uncharacterized protein n=1 Tax=Annulohypoxylon truncatum TaxID=327061 RepID=UPI00200787BC|nr:uncharacterized protein F4807DRAFT_456933 [Annulohypoxylon truncatum]KAI1213589.1 hypothetical protein F4807DRAFT_456933 [Annulohypoxylon truncatum]
MPRIRVKVSTLLTHIMESNLDQAAMAEVTDIVHNTTATVIGTVVGTVGTTETIGVDEIDANVMTGAGDTEGHEVVIGIDMVDRFIDMEVTTNIGPMADLMEEAKLNEEEYFLMEEYEESEIEDESDEYNYFKHLNARDIQYVPPYVEEIEDEYFAQPQIGREPWESDTGTLPDEEQLPELNNATDKVEGKYKPMIIGNGLVAREATNIPIYDLTPDMRNNATLKKYTSIELRMVNDAGDESTFGTKLAKLAESYDVWTDKGVIDLPEEEKMTVDLIEGWEKTYKPGQMYPLGMEDRKFLDETFGDMHDKTKME